MKINSAIRAMFGITVALGAAAAALPASAASVTINDSTGTANGVGEIIKPTSSGSVPVQCGISFALGLASGVSTGVAYTIPPATGLGQVTSATFTAGTSYCSAVSATGLPWTIYVNSITSGTTGTVTIDGVAFSHPTLGNCTSTNVNGTVTVGATTTTIAIPPFTMPSTTPSGTANGNCSSVGTITLTVSAAVAPFFTLTYP